MPPSPKYLRIWVYGSSCSFSEFVQIECGSPCPTEATASFAGLKSPRKDIGPKDQHRSQDHNLWVSHNHFGPATGFAQRALWCSEQLLGHKSWWDDTWVTGKDDEEESAYLAWTIEMGERCQCPGLGAYVLPQAPYWEPHSLALPIGTCVNDEMRCRFSPKLDWKTIIWTFDDARRWLKVVVRTFLL